MLVNNCLNSIIASGRFPSCAEVQNELIFAIACVRYYNVCDRSQNADICLQVNAQKLDQKVLSNLRRLTLRDIAKKAGVSYQTVSRVINNHPYVAEETRQRVLDLIAELDYRPNKAARSLAGHQANTIALVASDIYDYGLMQVVLNMERAAESTGYDLVMSIAGTEIHRAPVFARRLRICCIGISMIVLKPIKGFHRRNYPDDRRLAFGLGQHQYDDHLAPSLMINQEHGTRLLLGTPACAWSP